MGNRKPIKTKISDAVEYWAGVQDECGLSVDWAEAGERCWRCGCERALERYHIIPAALGGEDKPSNIVLLCKRCHAEGPNVADPEVMWDWIRAYAVPLYDTFWAVKGSKEYEFIYGNSLVDDLKEVLSAANVSIDDYESIISTKMKEIGSGLSAHFGQPYFNTATIAGSYRMLVKELAKEYGVSVPTREEPNKQLWRL